MTVTFKLERLDGTPAEPPSIETTVLAWSPGATIPRRDGCAPGWVRPRCGRRRRTSQDNVSSVVSGIVIPARR